MADSSITVSSAVIVPESRPPLSPPAKRRLSSTSDADSKRPRLSSDARSQSPRDTIRETARVNAVESDPKASAPPQDRRKASVQEERKRGQRLFGGLLSTLSQSTPNNQQKRRQEIERRQQERAKNQKVVDEGKKKERLANLQVVRKAEQIKYDEQTMKVRHSHMLARANFLSTRTEPKVYYKPWELQPAQEEHIQRQITETHAQIDHEREEFARRHHPRSPHGKEVDKTDNTTSNGPSEPRSVGEEQHGASPPAISHTASHANDVSADADTTNHSPPLPASHDTNGHFTAAQEENNGEVLMENDEDAVIY